MSLQFYNTLTKTKAPFRPLEAGKIKLYVCGITVYDLCHIGHARVLVAFDVITRFLRSQDWDVTYVRNITDIDDKILNRAVENNEPFDVLTQRMIEAMHQDERALNILPPDSEPRATAHMDEIIDMVQILVDNHYAYKASNGDVYYRVKRFADYGKLTNKNLDELLEGARVEVNNNKEDPRDFVLWKSADANDVSWESPWGKGRPGWHIECSAMSTCCLGDTFDIHGGGPDLPFPHHENEIAQSEAATGKKYVNYWMHAGAVRVDNEKMSKSLGNFFTIREVLKKYQAEVVRFFLISSHYRSPINYSEASLQEARSGLERFYTALRPYAGVQAASIEQLKTNPYYQRFVEVMEDDFNTREALSVMYELVKTINSQPEQAESLVAVLKGIGNVLGVLQQNPSNYFQWQPPRKVVIEALNVSGSIECISVNKVLANEQIEDLVARRFEAKINKNYQHADKIRQQLKEAGVVLEDSPEGTQWRRE